MDPIWVQCKVSQFSGAMIVDTCPILNPLDEVVEEVAPCAVEVVVLVVAVVAEEGEAMEVVPKAGLIQAHDTKHLTQLKTEYGVLPTRPVGHLEVRDPGVLHPVGMAHRAITSQVHQDETIGMIGIEILKEVEDQIEVAADLIERRTDGLTADEMTDDELMMMRTQSWTAKKHQV